MGWQLKKLVTLVLENPKEVVLFLKRRPCHADPFGGGHRKKRSNHLQAPSGSVGGGGGTFPAAVLKARKSRKGARTPLEELISTTPAETKGYDSE